MATETNSITGEVETTGGDTVELLRCGVGNVAAGSMTCVVTVQDHDGYGMSVARITGVFMRRQDNECVFMEQGARESYTAGLSDNPEIIAVGEDTDLVVYGTGFDSVTLHWNIGADIVQFHR